MISDRLKNIIEKLDLSQKAFAKSVGLTPSSLNDILNGRTKSISNTLQIAIQYVHGVNPDWLLTGEGEMFLERRREAMPVAAEPIAEYSAGPPAQSAGKNGLRAIDGSVQEYPDIDIIEKISRTRWWKELSETEREIIAFLLPLRNTEVKQKIRNVLAKSYLSQKSQDELQHDLAELMDELGLNELKQKGEAG